MTDRRITYRFGQRGKLIRPGKLQRMEEDGQQPISRQVVGDEHIDLALLKVEEEAREIANGGNTLDELGDLLHAVENLAGLLGYQMYEVAQASAEKYSQFGGFDEGILIETVTVTEGDPWHQHYSARPDLFFEVRQVNEG